jgi:hypothetical protein
MNKQEIIYGDSKVIFSKSNISRIFSGSPIDIITAVLKVEAVIEENAEKGISVKPEEIAPECKAALEQPIIAIPVAVSKSYAEPIKPKNEIENIPDCAPKSVVDQSVDNNKYDIDKNIKVESKKPKASMWDKVSELKDLPKKEIQKEEYHGEKILLA